MPGAGLFLIFRPLLPYLAAGVVAIGVAIGIYQAGYSSAERACNSAALRDQIRALEADIKIAEEAETNAKRLEAATAAREDDLRERLKIYDETSDAPDICALDLDDVERLRELTR